HGDGPSPERDRHAERDHRERQERREDRQYGCDRIDGPVGVRGRDAFLEEQLDAVRKRDQDAAWPGAHRSLPRLEVGDHLAFHPHVEQHGDQEREEHHGDPCDQQEPVEPVHQASTAAGSTVSDPRSGASTGSTVAAIENDPMRIVLAANPGWLNGTNTAPSTTCSVTRAGSSASPAAVRTVTAPPSITPRGAASFGWISRNGSSSSAAFSSCERSERRPSSTSNG